jgi:hypothetical protein
VGIFGGKVYTSLHTVKGGMQAETEKNLYKEKRAAYIGMNVHSVKCEIEVEP